jgi:hypothetical protein
VIWWLIYLLVRRVVDFGRARPALDQPHRRRRCPRPNSSPWILLWPSSNSQRPSAGPTPELGGTWPRRKGEVCDLPGSPPPPPPPPPTPPPPPPPPPPPASPPVPDQLTVPAQDCGGRDEGRVPPIPWQQPGQRREQPDPPAAKPDGTPAGAARRPRVVAPAARSPCGPTPPAAPSAWSTRTSITIAWAPASCRNHDAAEVRRPRSTPERRFSNPTPCAVDQDRFRA